MKKFQVSINGKSEQVIELTDNEAVTIHVQNNPMAEPPYPKTSIRANGSRWENQEYYELEWQERPLEIGDSISITYSENSAKPTDLLKCEKFVKPEEECSFCGKRKSEVEVLIKGGFFSFICNECVFVCVETVENFKKT